MGYARAPRPAARAGKARAATAPTQDVAPSPSRPIAAPSPTAALPRFSLANLPITAPPGPAQRATEAARPSPAHAVRPRPNRTGLPDRLKAGIETLSGVSMDGVRVHYNSPHPARLDALAYARGREIHVAPGQEAQLPHEAWHIVQQAQGRVRPTLQMDGGTPVNDDHGLESEADRMGQKAAAARAAHPVAPQPAAALPAGPAPAAPAQRSRSWWKKKGAASKALMYGGLAALGVGAVMASPVVAGLGALSLIGGGIAHYMGKPKAPTAPVTDEDWFGHKREKTAYSYTSSGPKGRQGPHFVPHIAKEMMSERSIQQNPNFDPTMIYEGSGLIPTAGQARKLISHHETSSGITIPMPKKKELDQNYKEKLRLRREAPTKDEQIRATVQSMEMNPMTTYAHGDVATHPEIIYKGENRKTMGPDLDKMQGMKKGQPDPTFAKIDHGRGNFKQTHLTKFLRDTGQISLGNPDLSDLDTDSESEYS